ncbi:hypothetical protein JX265_004267 [Neoarthrinium moseri]|uniref:3beta-hydroxysteroid 3-dehydrogenase n=1 Tax=Neoarthrinium moseri TaxID=1658444 RepID=A0A9P9WQL7_9PEZI|nr:hypothetical protein JX265_004267 [Neoarthrinium moseri]
MGGTGTILLTGANGGLGSAIVSAILSDSHIAQAHHGLYAVRSIDSASSVRAVLQTSNGEGHAHDLVPLDLASLSNVRSAAEQINRRVAAGEIPPIRVLILNAGWQEYTTHTLTDDGFDMAFQVNYLGHFLLTLLLLQSLDKEHGRIVVLGSWSHDTADPRNATGPQGKVYTRDGYKTIFTSDPWNGEDMARGKWSSAEKHPGDIEAGFRRYGASKLCEVMMMREFSRRVESDQSLSRVAVLGVDPGAMPSSLGSRGTLTLRMIFKLVMPLLNPIASALQPNGMLRTTKKSAGDVIRACFDSETLGDRPNGVYLDGSQAGDVGAEAKDREKCERLWRASLVWAGVKEGDTVLGDWR